MIGLVQILMEQSLVKNIIPIKRVGLYIPGGNVPLVSTVLMTVILAQVAKVPEIAVVTPPAADGTISPKLLGALQYLGINEVYKVGGAQAIGALAYGTNLIPSVDKNFWAWECLCQRSEAAGFRNRWC